MSADEVATYCREACGDDEELHRFLVELVDAAKVGDERVRESVQAIATDVTQQASLAGTRVGAYRLDTVIGRGGMGTVYLASRADGEFEKNVVVKLIRQTLYDDEFVRHFRAERQVLANLQHPYIPALIDAGQLPNGRPYLVAEYVEGLPIDAYCETENLSRRQRLRLFEELCKAVQHAHSNLVLHLDIKPDNILIADDGTPRLLDFGIARLIGDASSGNLALTPQYASPEQLAGKSLSAGSDIYSLGVLLYVLLSGRRPFSASRFVPAETRIAERGALAQMIEQPDPLPGTEADLQAVVRKAMATQVKQRYNSVEMLRQDLERYRKHLPLVARPNTYTYRLGKFARRRAPGLAITAGIIGLSLAFAVRESDLRSEAEVAHANANQEKEAANQVANFLTELFKVSDPGEARGNSVTARELLDKGSQRIANDLAEQPLVAAQLMHTMGRVYVNLGLFKDALPLLDSSLSLRESMLSNTDAAVAEVLVSLGDVYTRSADFDAAEQALRRALEIRRVELGETDPAVGLTLQSLGSLLLRQGRRDEALAAHLEGIPIQEAALGSHHPDVGKHYAALGMVYRALGKTDDSERVLLRAIDILEDSLGADHPALGTIIENLGNVYNQTGQYDDAEVYLTRSLSMREKVFDADHPYLSYSLMNLAALFTNTDRLPAAEEYTRRAIAIQEKAFKSDDYRLALSRNNLGEIYFKRGQLDKAQHEGILALNAMRGNLDPGHTYIGSVHNLLGKVFHAQRKFEKAERHHRAAYGVFADRDADDAVRKIVAADYAEFLRDLGRGDEAVGL